MIAGMAVLAFSACTKEQQEELKLEAELLMQYQAVEFTLEPTEALGEVQLTLSLDGEALAQMLSDNGYRLDQLKEFTFNSADVHIANGDGRTYDALQSITMEIATDGTAPVIIATKDPIPDGVNAFTFNVPSTNVADILRHNEIHVIAKLNVEQAVTDTTYHLLNLGGKVVVKL